MNYTVFIDAGVTAATWGDLVQQVTSLDIDGQPDLLNWTQTTASNQPTLARIPRTGIRNLHSNDGSVTFNNAVASYTPNQLTDGHLIFGKLAEAVGTNNHRISANIATIEQGKRYTLSLPLRAAGRNFFAIQNNTSTTDFDLVWDIAGQSVSTSQGDNFVAGGYSNGFFWVTFDAAATETLNVAMRIQTSGEGVSLNHDGDGESGALVGRIQLEEIGSSETGPTAFQARNSDHDIVEPGKATHSHLFFDGVSDSVRMTVVDAFTGDIAISSLEGTWIERNVTINAGATYATPAATNGGTQRIMEGLGNRIVAITALDGGLSAQDEASLNALCKNHGVPGVLSEGAEILTNGGFDTDLSGWTDTSDGTGTVTQTGGLARFTYSDNSNKGQIEQTISTGPGIYLVDIQNTGDRAVWARLETDTETASPVIGRALVGGIGLLRITTSANAKLVLFATSSGTGTCDVTNISLTKLT